MRHIGICRHLDVADQTGDAIHGRHNKDAMSFVTALTLPAGISVVAMVSGAGAVVGVPLAQLGNVHRAVGVVPRVGVRSVRMVSAAPYQQMVEEDTHRQVVNQLVHGSTRVKKTTAVHYRLTIEV